MMNIDYEELVDGAIDEIDAALFSGDTFHDEEAIEDFRRIMERWERRLVEIKSILDEDLDEEHSC
jgi:hypothetical protein